jgi:hypothetical protein
MSEKATRETVKQALDCYGPMTAREVTAKVQVRDPDWTIGETLTALHALMYENRVRKSFVGSSQDAHYVSRGLGQ